MGVFLLSTLQVCGQSFFGPPEVEKTERVYHQTDTSVFRLHIFKDERQRGDLPCLVFFHGWGKVTAPEVFFPQCRYLAERGILAVSVEYRVDKQQHFEAVRNALRAMEWIRDHSDELEIDPERIGIAGGSGGGWTSSSLTTVCTDLGLNRSLLENGIPAVMILFNPYVGSFTGMSDDHNPSLHLKGQQPPTLIMIGTEDKFLESNRKYCQKSQELGNSCEIVVYEGADHAFFNYGRHGNRYFYETLLAADRFLARQGFLTGEPTLKFENLENYALSQNPIIRHMYTADPSARVFNDTLFVYPSHDEDDAEVFSMVDWHVFSTTDLKDWTDHGVIFSLDDISWAEHSAWAPDCIEKDGKYYFYYPVEQKHIGVAVSDRPTGPFKDPLGRPLISENTPGVVSIRDFIDPTAFMDDDGKVYLYMGQIDLNVVELNDDMISYDGPVHIIEGAKDFFEAVWIHKYKGTYYLSYSTRGKEDVTGPQIVYATSKNVLGPYEYQGVILDEMNSGTNHHSIVEYEGQWYLFYHNSDLYYLNQPGKEVKFGWGHQGSPHPFRRSICVDRLYYNEDGTIREVRPTGGVGVR